jgi:hypothetical protein
LDFQSMDFDHPQYFIGYHRIWRRIKEIHQTIPIFWCFELRTPFKWLYSHQW